VNPMVMFYNRDMLTSSFTVKPPQTWDEVIELNKKVTKQNDAGLLTTQTVALGAFDNIMHAKELIAMLIFQAGNPIVIWDDLSKKYMSVFGESSQDGANPAESALMFYTNFANPVDKDRYSWNATLPNNRDQFIAGKLAIYFGYASEAEGIRLRNPNLNFQMAMMPQRSNVPTKVTYGDLLGMSVMKMSQNPQLAVIVMQTLASQASLDVILAENQSYAPARLDMLGGSQQNGLQTLVYNSAIISKSFLDPDAKQTTAFFKKMIDQINAGLAQPNDVVGSGNALLTSILNAIQK
jgi:ABC-type glycerol-3-phosphate transport system substrate-binding protein